MNNILNYIYEEKNGVKKAKPSLTKIIENGRKNKKQISRNSHYFDDCSLLFRFFIPFRGSGGLPALQ